MNLTTWIVIGIGALMVALGVPLMQRRIPPNQAYGFRVPKTLKPGNEAIWYDANAYGGKLFIVGGIVQVLAAVLLSYVLNPSTASYSWSVVAVMVTIMLLMVVMSFRHLKTL